MRIVQFIDSTDEGGAEKVVVDISAGLVELGHQVTILHMGNDWLEQKARDSGIRTILLEERGAYQSLRTLPAFCKRMAKSLIELEPTVVHSHLVGAVLAGAYASRLASCLAVGTLHDAYSIKDSWKGKLMVRLSAAMGSQIVCVSEDMKSIVDGIRFGPGQEQVDVVYNGVELADRARCWQPTMAHTTDPVTLIVVARLVPVKAHRVLIEALRLLKTSVAWKLLVVGDGGERQDLEANVRSSGLETNIEFLGLRDDISDLLAESQIFVLTSSSEGMSISILESMAAGIPAVVSRVGGNPELVIDGESGFVIEANDANGFADAIRQLLENFDRRVEMGMAARARAGNLFQKEAMARRYAKIFGELSSQ